MSIFDSVGTVKKPKSNKFNLSRQSIMTVRSGNIYPVCIQELIPGDKIRVSPNAVIKSAPTVDSPFCTLSVDFHAFFVPYRIMWSYWDKWIYDPTVTDRMPPHASLLKFLQLHGELPDYLGFPSYTEQELEDAETSGISSKPDDVPQVNIWRILAYHRIWSEYFRDEDLQETFNFLDDTTITDFDTYISEWDDNETRSLEEFIKDFHIRAYAKDYFTSARPWAQKGNTPSIQLLSSDTAPVYFHNASKFNVGIAETSGGTSISRTTAAIFGDWNGVAVNGQVDDDKETNKFFAMEDPHFSTSGGNKILATTYSGGSLNADLSDVSNTIDISDLRQMFAIQRYLEINAITGSRIIEGNLAYFGVRIKDSRAQIPEFLGLRSSYINTSEVTSVDGSSLGKRGGQQNASLFGKPWNYFATEHGVFMVLMSIRPKMGYFQGIPRDFFRLDQFDYALPLFQHLGEQEVVNRELYLDITQPYSESDNDVNFGYQSRYADYRSSFDELHGDMRSEGLEHWHNFRVFSQTPILDEDFILADPQNMHIFAVQTPTDYQYLANLYFDFKALRPLQYHTQPALIG